MLRWFFLFDSAVHLFLGALLFCSPQFVGDFLLQRSTDGIHWHLLRCVGGQFLALAFLAWRCSSTRCYTEVRTACLVLHLLSGILCTFLFLHARALHPGLVQPLFLRTFIWFNLGTAFLSFFLLIIYGWQLGDQLYRENRWGNILYQCDTIAAMTIGIAWVIAPEWLLHRQVRVVLDLSHEFCGRLMGLLFIASNVISSHALHWRQHSDRAMAAEIRAILCLFVLTAQIWSQIAYGQHWSDKHWVGISLFSSWTVIAIFYRSYLWISGTDKMLHEAKEGSSPASQNDVFERTKKTM